MLFFSGHVFAAARLEPLTVGVFQFYRHLCAALDRGRRTRRRKVRFGFESDLCRPSAAAAVARHRRGAHRCRLSDRNDDVAYRRGQRSGVGGDDHQQNRHIAILQGGDQERRRLEGQNHRDGRPAAFLDATVRYVLRSKFGLDSRSRREVVAHRRTLSRSAGVGAGRRRRGGDVDPALVHCAQSRLSGSWPVSTSSASSIRTRAWWCCGKPSAKNPELVERFLKCIVEGIYIFKTNKAKTLAVFKRYMKGADDEILEETYQAHSRDLGRGAASVRASREGRVGNAVAAISAGEANRRELDRRAIVHENASTTADLSGRCIRNDEDDSNAFKTFKWFKLFKSFKPRKGESRTKFALE